MAARTKKQIILYVLFMICFIIYLCFCNNIVVALNKSLNKVERVTEVDKGTGCYVNVNIFDEVLDNGGLDIITLEGVAFCKTADINNERYIHLVLQGEKNTYIIETFLSDDGTYKFLSQFPTIQLPEDTYKVGLYVYENEYVSGYIDINKTWVKDFTGIHDYFPTEVEEIKVQDYDTVAVNLVENRNSLNNGYYEIQGLAAKLNCDSIYSSIYLKLIFENGTSRYFETILETDSRFNNFFSTDQYTFSKFTAKIPQAIVQGQRVNIQVIAENDGVSACNEYFPFEFTEQGYIDSFARQIDNSILEYYNDKVVINSFVNDLTNIRGNCYFFSGLAYLNDIFIEDKAIYLQLEYNDNTKNLYPMQIVPNGWIVKNYGEQYASGCYQAKISVDDIRHENVDVYILISDGDKYYRTEQPVKYLWRDDHFVKLNN